MLRLVAGVGVFAAILLFVGLPFTPSADAFAVYFPVVWGLAEGEGLSAFYHLENGIFRAPLYSVALFLASAGGVALRFGIGLIITLSSAALLVAGVGRATPADRPPTILIAFALVTAPAFVVAMTAVTPDALGSALLALSLRSANPKHIVLSGALLGLSILARFNFIALVPAVVAFVWIEQSPRYAARFVAGAAIILVGWSLVSLLAGRGVVWFPSGATYLPPQTLGGGLTAPASLVQRPGAIAMAIVTGTPRTLFGLAKAAGPLVCGGAAVGLVIGWMHNRRETVWLISWIVSVVAPIALVHPEARYFLAAIVLLIWLAAGCWSTVRKSHPRALRAASIVLVVAALAYGGRTAARRYSQLGQGAAIIEETRALVLDLDVEGRVTADRLAFLYTPLRYVLWPRAVECCGIETDADTIIMIRRHAAEFVAPSAFRELLTPDDSFFRVFRRAAATPDR